MITAQSRLGRSSITAQVTAQSQLAVTILVTVRSLWAHGEQSRWPIFFSWEYLFIPSEILLSCPFHNADKPMMNWRNLYQVRFCCHAHLIMLINLWLIEEVYTKEILLSCPFHNADKSMINWRSLYQVRFYCHAHFIMLINLWLIEEVYTKWDFIVMPISSCW